MFSKKCPSCNNKTEKEFDYCPTCGNNLTSEYEKEDYGYLGKNDTIEPENVSQFGGSFIDRIFNNTLKMLDKQMKSLTENLTENQKSQQNSGLPNNLRVQFFVNGKNVFPQQRQLKPTKQQPTINRMNPEKMKRFSKLPKQEPISKMKRLSGKIIYELEVPGVNNLDDILITPLENSIEIKALSDNIVYSKTLNMKLPLLRYGLDNGNLIVEFQG